jgi:hypothetical protein
MNRLIDYLVDRWLQSCPHHGNHVLADAFEGHVSDLEVKYCRRCGAIRVNYPDANTEWRRPRPLWHPKGGREA